MPVAVEQDEVDQLLVVEQDEVDQLQTEVDALTETVLGNLKDVEEHWHEVKLVMHGRLKMAAFEDLPEIKKCRNIPDDDIALSGLQGESMLMKLNRWCSVFFSDPASIEGFTMTKRDTFYLLALLLFTDTDKYHDMITLFRWLHSEPPAVLFEFFHSEVFQKRWTAASARIVSAMICEIKVWVVAQKDRVVARAQTGIGQADWFRELKDRLPEDAQIPVTAALQLISKLRLQDHFTVSPLGALLEDLIARNIDAATWRALLAGVVAGNAATSALDMHAADAMLPEWLDTALKEFLSRLHRTNKKGRPDNRARVMSPRCRLMYDVGPQWKKERDAALAAGARASPTLQLYTAKRWQKLSTRERLDRYTAPYSLERDKLAASAAPGLRSASWSETSKVRVCIEDSEDGSGSEAGSVDFGPCFGEDAGILPEAALPSITLMERGGSRVEPWALLQGKELMIEYTGWAQPGSPTTLRFEPECLHGCMMHFLRCRAKWPRPCRIASLDDWPEARPFGVLASGTRYASDLAADMAHQRSATAQTHLIEMGGALHWMDQAFHPLGDWSAHVKALLLRNRYFVRSMKRPRVTAASYRRAVLQLRACMDAAGANDARAFRSNMGVFSEKVFQEEMSSASLSDPCSLSHQLGDMLEKYRAVGKKAELNPKARPTVTRAELQAHPQAIGPWLEVINELAAKADHIAVLVVDALCASIGAAVNNFADIVFDEDACSLARKLKTVAFTDTTAPSYYAEYWASKGSSTLMQLESASRVACQCMPRARFPDTPYAESLQQLRELHGLFVRRLWVDTSVNTFKVWRLQKRERVAGRKTALAFKIAELRETLKESICESHFYHWKPEEIVFAAVAMVKYARYQRQIQLDIRKEARQDLSDCGPARAHRDEIYANLDQAEIMLGVVISARETQGEERRLAMSDNTPQDFVREIAAVRKHWRAEDAKYSKQELVKERERRKAVAALVSKCAKGACSAVVTRARILDREAATRQLEEDNARRERVVEQDGRRVAAHGCIARCVSFAPRIVRRKARHVEREARLAREAGDDEARKVREAGEAQARGEERARSAAVAIALNRAAHARREAALEARAKVEQRAVAEARRAEKKKRLLQRKAEHKEREARAQAEFEAAERARKERWAAEAAAVAQEERARAAAEAEAAREGATRAALEMRVKARACYACPSISSLALCDRMGQRALDTWARNGLPFTRTLLAMDTPLFDTSLKTCMVKVMPEVKREAEQERARLLQAKRLAERERQHAELERQQAQRQTDIAERDKVWNFKRAKALKLWRARVRATHTAQALLESRARVQAHCSAIMREATASASARLKWAKKGGAETREAMQEVAGPLLLGEQPVDPPRPTECMPPPASPPPPPLPPLPAEPASHEAQRGARLVGRQRELQRREQEDLGVATGAPTPALAFEPRKIAVEAVELASKPLAHSPTRQWNEDYNRALAHARGWSQQQWDTKTGWATGRDAWFGMGGYPFVAQMTNARQEQDLQYARFQANYKNMQRVQQKQNDAQARFLARQWQAQQDRHEEQLAVLDYEQKRLEALEVEIAEVEKQGEERRTRYAVLREYLDGLEAATEAERRELSAQRCAQLRNRTGTNYDANLAVNECVLCFAEPCDQIATPCHHVIGCEACVVKQRNAIGPKCPICLEPATFEKMHFP